MSRRQGLEGAKLMASYLREAGVHFVRVNYYGYGDDGSVTECTGYKTHEDCNEHRNQVDLTSIRPAGEKELGRQVAAKLQGLQVETLHDQIIDMTYTILDLMPNVGDWVNNAGGRGEIVIDLAEGTARSFHQSGNDDGEYNEDGDQVSDQTYSSSTGSVRLW